MHDLYFNLCDNNSDNLGNMMVNLSRKRVKCEYFGKNSKLLPDKTKEIEAELKTLQPEYTEKCGQNGCMLTQREIEVLNCLVKGMNNTEISEKLFISIPTVKSHISKIINKLGASDRAEVIHIAKQKNYFAKARI